MLGDEREVEARRAKPRVVSELKESEVTGPLSWKEKRAWSVCRLIMEIWPEL